MTLKRGEISPFVAAAKAEAAGIGCRGKPLAAFLAHYFNAKHRGIPFEFSFLTWWEWWQTDGRWAKRGRGREQLVMARLGDVGPYSAENTYCASNLQNIRDVGRERRSAFMREWHLTHAQTKVEKHI